MGRWNLFCIRDEVFYWGFGLIVTFVSCDPVLDSTTMRDP
jgi:hypothetical protein